MKKTNGARSARIESKTYIPAASGVALRRTGMRAFLLAIGALVASIALAGSAPPVHATDALVHPHSVQRAGAALQPQGGLQFFTDEAAFDAALGVPSELTTETFEGARRPDSFQGHAANR